MSVKIRANLPHGDRDGLQIAADRLRIKKQRGEPFVVVAEVYLRQVTERLGAQEDPMDYELRVSHIEVATDDADAGFLRSILGTRYESCTGKAQLPFGTIMDETSEGDGGETDDR